MCSLQIGISDRILPFELIVLLDCRHDFILGWNFLKASEAIIDCGRSVLTLDDVEVTSEDIVFKPLRVCVIKDCGLPAQTYSISKNSQVILRLVLHTMLGRTRDTTLDSPGEIVPYRGPMMRSRTCNVKGTNYRLTSRLVFAFRAIGRGRTAEETFCGLINFTSPPDLACNVVGSIAYHHLTCYLDNPRLTLSHLHIPNFFLEFIGNKREFIFPRKTSKKISGKVPYRFVTMVHGRKEAISPSMVLLQLRVLILENLYFKIFSKHCRGKTAFNSIHKPSCIANYNGKSRDMEVKCVTAIFERSEAHYGVRYAKSLCDGDSRSFSSVLTLNPYDT
ncbi:transposon Ty3-I Gag-Pol polyprotein [Trichonephila clavipes]|nr:transposon Ty3-I Gag-Pol polyprotein [Trichonephila clavipes]